MIKFDKLFFIFLVILFAIDGLIVGLYLLENQTYLVLWILHFLVFLTGIFVLEYVKNNEKYVYFESQINKTENKEYQDLYQNYDCKETLSIDLIEKYDLGSYLAKPKRLRKVILDKFSSEINLTYPKSRFMTYDYNAFRFKPSLIIGGIGVAFLTLAIILQILKVGYDDFLSIFFIFQAFLCFIPLLSKSKSIVFIIRLLGRG